MSEHNISVDNGEHLVHVGEPLAHCPTFIEFVRDGKIVGTISARFDFTDLPDELHSLGINMIYRQMTRVGLPGKERVEHTKHAKLSWWKRLNNYIGQNFE